MGLTVQVPTVGQANSTEAVKVTNTLTNLNTWANGGITAPDVAAAFAQSAGMNQSGQTVKGVTNITATESRSSTTYGTLTTPDQVSGITLPANGLIQIWYHATWQESVNNAARAAIFIGSNQLKLAFPGINGAPIAGGAQAAGEAYIADSSAAVAKDNVLGTVPTGLGSLQGNNGSGLAYSGDVTTGQIVGVVYPQLTSTVFGAGPCWVFAAAGTYTVSVQFKASSGSVTAKNRTLWVQAVSFA